VRVRLADGVGTLTIKGAQVGIGRAEYEYEIPLAEAQEILESLTVGAVVKTRYTLNRTPGTWTVDVFEEKNEGLILLEVERSESFELEERPEWLGVEVTNDSRYKNAALSTYPISTWE
jgi:adenylate cyclase